MALGRSRKFQVPFWRRPLANATIRWFLMSRLTNTATSPPTRSKPFPGATLRALPTHMARQKTGRQTRNKLSRLPRLRARIPITCLRSEIATATVFAATMDKGRCAFLSMGSKFSQVTGFSKRPSSTTSKYCRLLSIQVLRQAWCQATTPTKMWVASAGTKASQSRLTVLVGRASRFRPTPILASRATPIAAGAQRAEGL